MFVNLYCCPESFDKSHRLELKINLRKGVLVRSDIVTGSDRPSFSDFREFRRRFYADLAEFIRIPDDAPLYHFA